MRIRACSRDVSLLLLLLVGPLTASAVGEFTPYASAQTEYNSNIFALQSRERALALNGDDRLSDLLFRAIAGAEGNLSLSQQKLRAKVEARRIQFSHYKQLDHNEYLLGGGLDWRATRAFSGLVNLSQERRMASFEDRRSTVLTLETERKAQGTANIDITPHWRLEAGLARRDLDSPLPLLPEFKLQEDTVSAALKYLIADHFAAGLYTEYLQGRYDGTTDPGKFKQQSVDLTGDYSVENFSSFGAAIGVTQREEGAGGSQQALTGKVSYRRELTGKTKIDLQAFRRVRSYVGGASSVTEDGALAAVIWQTTEKTAVSAQYQHTQGRFQDAGTSAGNSGRRDRGDIASARIDYQMLPWLAIRPYGEYQTRKSNQAFDSFSATFVGLELKVRLQ